MEWPKISIVTPSYNQAAWIEYTLQSVLDQGYPNLEHIIIDGGSTDGSVEIIRKYESRLAHFESLKDDGMYHAINRGLSLATGEIMGWINSDDILHPKSLFTLARIFKDIPDAEWITGVRSVIDEHGCCVANEPARSWSIEQLLLGDYQWIQQESTFWRSSLYKKTGSKVSTEYKLAGDFELWFRFIQQAKLYSTDALLGGFRVRSQNQASLEGLDSYEKEVRQILASWQPMPEVQQNLERIRSRNGLLKMLKGLAKDRLNQKFVQPYFTVASRIYFDRNSQTFKT